MRKLFIALTFLLLLGDVAHAVGTGGSITCPTSMYYYPAGSFPVAYQWFNDGSSWRFGTYHTFSSLGWSEAIVGQFYDNRGFATTT